jgi:VIT1/CCC1 family predicted Fe2+/Mn2+ transporter
MGLAEALSDDGSVTGRGGPILRGAITGIATAIGGMLHTFPFLISNLSVALNVAYAVVVGELIAIAFIRYRFMSGNLWTTIGQVIVGGGIVLAFGWVGSALVRRGAASGLHPTCARYVSLSRNARRPEPAGNIQRNFKPRN